MKKKKTYLTVHGHFYQPPRENPWLEAIELQDSALPFHDWNERITSECYNPNSVAKIVNNENKILDIVNNYSYMSFNFGATLMSWLEKHAPLTYDRIIKADIESYHQRNGHGNAIAQVYNHIIMPLANLNDKITQVKWGIADFKYRFGRMPEGMWLAETAVDDETLKVLAQNGIKFTILSPYQAQSVRKMQKDSEQEYPWQDVSWGNIDPAKPYRYFIKSEKNLYIDLFFYDGAISKSVAFDNLLSDGSKLIQRLKDGISDYREEDELVNIATDGESYGHHTKFGDMALAYALRVKAEDEGFILTNYGEFLATHEVQYEVDIKQNSSWSCCHGVERWRSNCGCSTGGPCDWNQNWRKPLRDGLNYLRDRLIVLFENEGQKYFKNVYDARNGYIQVILDRSESNLKNFYKNFLKPDISDSDKLKAIKLLEIQRQAMLMFTSCGWFFAELSGLEPVQILKYAAYAMQLANDFTDEDFESEFLKILSKAQSNISEMGNGRDVYERFVKPSIVTLKQIASLWAIKSLYEDFEDEVLLYSYTVRRIAYKKVSKGATNLVIGRVEIKSTVTFEKSDIMFALLQYEGGDFHCAIKKFTSMSEYTQIQKALINVYMTEPLTEIIRKLDDNFGSKYFTLKDIFIEERRQILHTLIKDQIRKFSSVYEEIYEDSKSSVYHLQSLGLPIPSEFKIAAQYILSRNFNEIIRKCGKYFDNDSMQLASEINNEAKKISVTLDKTEANRIFSKRLLQKMFKLSNNIEIQRAEGLLELFNYVKKLELDVDISDTRSIYYNNIFHKMQDIIDEFETSETLETDKKLVDIILRIGENLDIVTDFYRKQLC